MNWRVGSKVGRTLYRDDQLVGVMDTRELAAEVVGALTAQQPFTEGQKAERLNFVDHLRHDLDCAEDESVRPAIRRLKDKLAAAEARALQAEAELTTLKQSPPFTYEHQHEITGLTAERDWEHARADRAEAELKAAREQMERLQNRLDTAI